MESHAAMLAWLHSEMGYTFETIAGLTYPELAALQLGFVSQKEASNDRVAAAAGDKSAETERMKREHKQSIRRRLMRGE